MCQNTQLTHRILHEYITLDKTNFKPASRNRNRHRSVGERRQFWRRNRNHPPRHGGRDASLCGFLRSSGAGKGKQTQRHMAAHRDTDGLRRNVRAADGKWVIVECLRKLSDWYKWNDVEPEIYGGVRGFDACNVSCWAYFFINFYICVSYIKLHNKWAAIMLASIQDLISWRFIVQIFI